MTSKTILAGIVFAALAACGSKSDAPAAGSAAGTDPAASASDPNAPGGRSGRIDPGAFRKHRGDDPGVAPSGDPNSAAAAANGGGGAPADQMSDRMKAIDTDGDGKISEEERNAARVKRAGEMHTKLDTNGDGKLSAEEVAASPMFARMMKRSPDAVAGLDKNGDGDISADELAAGMATMRDHRRGMGGWGGGGDRTQPSAPSGGSAQ